MSHYLQKAELCRCICQCHKARQLRVHYSSYGVRTWATGCSAMELIWLSAESNTGVKKGQGQIRDSGRHAEQT